MPKMGKLQQDTCQHPSPTKHHGLSLFRVSPRYTLYQKLLECRDLRRLDGAVAGRSRPTYRRHNGELRRRGKSKYNKSWRLAWTLQGKD